MLKVRMTITSDAGTTLEEMELGFNININNNQAVIADFNVMQDAFESAFVDLMAAGIGARAADEDNEDENSSYEFYAVMLDEAGILNSWNKSDQFKLLKLIAEWHGCTLAQAQQLLALIDKGKTPIFLSVDLLTVESFLLNFDKIKKDIKRVVEPRCTCSWESVSDEFDKEVPGWFYEFITNGMRWM